MSKKLKPLSWKDFDKQPRSSCYGKAGSKTLMAKPTKVTQILLVEKFNKDGSVDRWLETKKGKVELPSYPKGTVSIWPSDL